jgi:hypothetical protein
MLSNSVLNNEKSGVNHQQKVKVNVSDIQRFLKTKSTCSRAIFNGAFDHILTELQKGSVLSMEELFDESLKKPAPVVSRPAPVATRTPRVPRPPPEPLPALNGPFHKGFDIYEVAREFQHLERLYPKDPRVIELHSRDGR